MSIKLSGKDIVAPVAWMSTMETSTAGSWRNQRPLLRSEKCTGCNVCWKFCPEPAIQVHGKIVQFDLRVCKGCGVCAEVCAPRAIAMVPEDY